MRSESPIRIFIFNSEGTKEKHSRLAPEQVALLVHASYQQKVYTALTLTQTHTAADLSSRCFLLDIYDKDVNPLYICSLLGVLHSSPQFVIYFKTLYVSAKCLCTLCVGSWLASCAKLQFSIWCAKAVSEPPSHCSFPHSCVPEVNPRRTRSGIVLESLNPGQRELVFSWFSTGAKQ